MSREVRRVPLTFDWPLDKVWEGYVTPKRFDEDDCPDCSGGWSERAEELKNLWYGQSLAGVPMGFDPASKGSTPFLPEHPVIWAQAQRNADFYVEHYSYTKDAATIYEAMRLADRYNSQWEHHLSQEEVDLLVADDLGLRDFTHTYDPKRSPGWQRKDPPYRPTAAEVNEWSLLGMGHSSSALYVLQTHYCEAEGVPLLCQSCDGRGSTERYEGQRAEHDAWRRTEPPTGEGWQVWETVSEGSPVTRVFSTAEELIGHLMTVPLGGLYTPCSIEQAENFVNAGSSLATFVIKDGEFIDGVKAVTSLGKGSET